MLWKFLFVVAVLHCSITIDTAKRRFNLEFFNFTCTNFTTRIKVFECDFQKIDINYFTFRERLMLKQDIDNRFEIRIWVQFIRQNMRTAVRLIDLKMKLCDALSHSFANPMLKGLLAELRRTTNVPYMCPLKKNVLYKMDNFTVTEKYLPTYTPFLNFTFALEYFENSRLIAVSKVLGAAVPTA